jgi:hypothetical protein
VEPERQAVRECDRLEDDLPDRVRLVVTEPVLTCDAVIAGTVRSRHDQRRADVALVVFAGGASCAARWAIGANEERSALVIITGAWTSC